MFKSKWRKYLEKTLVELVENQNTIIQSQNKLFSEIEIIKNNEEWLQKSINNVYEQGKMHDVCINNIYEQGKVQDLCINNVYEIIKTQELCINNIYEQGKVQDLCINNVYDKLRAFEGDITNKLKVLEGVKYTDLEYLASHLIDKSEKKILISGFYGSYNLGDELMLQTLLQYIPSELYSSVTVLLYRNEMYDVSSLPPVNFIHYPNNTYNYDYLAKEFDVLVWGGGALIDDTYYHLGVTNILGNMIVDMSSRFIARNKKVVGIGLSASKQFTNMQYVTNFAKVANKFEYLSVRDKYSADLLSKHGIQNIIQGVDIVYGNKEFFNRQPNKQEGIVETVGVTFVCLEETKTAFEKLLNLIDKRFGQKCIIKCIPFFDYNKNDVNFFAEMKEKYDKNDRMIICDYKNNISDVCEEIEATDVMINMRYHSMLLSLFLGKRTFNISYNVSPHYYNKVLYIMEQFNIDGNVVDYDVFCDEKFDSIGELKTPIERTDLYLESEKEIYTIINNIMR